MHAVQERLSLPRVRQVHALDGLLSEGHVKPRVRWGIQMRSVDATSWRGPLGCGWMGATPAERPAWVDSWPASFETRARARAQARAMTERFRYLGPHYGWRFRPVRIVITVRVT